MSKQLKSCLNVTEYWLERAFWVKDVLILSWSIRFSPIEYTHRHVAYGHQNIRLMTFDPASRRRDANVLSNGSLSHVKWRFFLFDWLLTRSSNEVSFLIYKRILTYSWLFFFPDNFLFEYSVTEKLNENGYNEAISSNLTVWV